MKKTLLLVSFVCLTAICISAQKGSPPPPPPDAAPDYTPESWKEYSYPQDNLRFRFPDEPKITESAKDGRTYERHSFMTFTLSVSDAGIDVGNDKEQQRKYLILIALSLDENFKASGAKLLKSEDISVDGNPAKLFIFESKDGIISRAKVFVVKDKVYSAEADVKKGERRGLNSENDFEKPAMAFLDSIHMISK